MKKGALKNLTIRSAVARSADVGNIIACDLKKEEEDIPHAYIFKWQSGKFTKSESNFDAHSICFISKPEPALVFIASNGDYGIHYSSGTLAGDIFSNSQPHPKVERFGGFRSITTIKDQAYAVGLSGMVYRLDRIDQWTRIDEGLPDSFDIEAIHGFTNSDLYCVGDDGELWLNNGTSWEKKELPSNTDLNTVLCAGDDQVYVGGQNGILLCGRSDAWQIIPNEEMEDDIWDLEWFNNTLYVSTLSGVYELIKDELHEVSFGNDAPKSCYQLSKANGILWSIGEYDIMAFNGHEWSRIV